MVESPHLYFDLLKRCLLNLIYEDDSTVPGGSTSPFDRDARLEGRDWPTQAHTMIGMARLNSLQRCAEEVIQAGIPGDFLEAGVWRGGATILLQGVLKAYGISDRRIWVADSFEGLPKPDEKVYPRDAGDDHHTREELAVSLEEVRGNFLRYGLLDSNVRFLPGWFRNTLPQAPLDTLALLRIDGDMYESTRVALDALYPKLSPGGMVIVDDYGVLPPCREAVEDFRREHAISDSLHWVDWTGILWKKSS